MSDKSNGLAALAAAAAAATPVDVGVGCSTRDGPKTSYKFRVYIFD